VKRLLLLFSCLPGVVGAQYSFDFEAGALSTWVQEPSDRWELSSEAAISGSYSLHHAYDNSSSGVDAIAIQTEYPDLNDTLRVSFRYRHAYAPSSSNNWQFAIMATSAGLSDQPAPDGWYLGVNFSGSDDLLRLWKQCGEERTIIAETNVSLQQDGCEEDEPLLVVVHYPDGTWLLSWSRSGDVADLIPVAEAKEVIQTGNRWFGLRYAYSSSQDRKLWLDELEISGTFFSDSLAPVLGSVSFASPGELVLTFNEPVLLTANARLFVDKKEADSLCVSASILRAFFKDDFPNRVEMLMMVEGLSDQDGNVIPATSLAIMQNLPEFGDVITSEVMADPYPEVYLPGCEYLELYNRSKFDLELEGCSLSLNEREFILPAHLMKAGGRVCIVPLECSGLDGPDFLHLLSANALPNGGATVVIRDRWRKTLAAVAYPDATELGGWKADGGWSLEWADPDRLCGGKENWYFSVADEGGTPGKKNSINLDLTDDMAPQLEYLGVEDSLLRLVFNEALALELPAALDFRLLPMEVVPFDLQFSNVLRSGIELNMGDQLSLFESGRLMVPELYDCAGNRSEELQIPFGYPVTASEGSLQLSEVLYNPVEGCPEFVELYNGGEHFIDLANYSLSLGDVVAPDPKPLSEASHLAQPGSYLVITPDPGLLAAHYSVPATGNWLQPEQFPLLTNSGAAIVLLNRSGELIDEMEYSDDMHHLYLGDAQGVSLERLSFDRPASDRENWHSASAAAGYATPGRSNSQAISSIDNDKLVTLSTSLLSPDNDGWDDVLGIMLSPGDQGFLADISITDIYGLAIRTVCSAAIAGNRETWFWDGRDDTMTNVPPGIYVVHVVFYHPDGRRFVVRKTLALIYR